MKKLIKQGAIPITLQSLPQPPISINLGGQELLLGNFFPER